MRSSIFVTLALLLLFGGVASAESCAFSSAPGFQLKSDTVEWAMKIAGGHTCIRGLRSGAVSSSTVEIISPSQFGKVRVLGPRLFIRGESRLSRAGHIHSTSVGYPHEDAGDL